MANDITTKKPATMAEYQKFIVNDLMTQLNADTVRGLVLPKNYVPMNALQSAMLIINQTVDKDKRLALSVCTEDSVKQALLDMLQQGLSPSKRQCYFIIFGNKLTMLTSYFGEIAKSKASDPNIKEIYAENVYKGDLFKYNLVHGHKVVSAHEQDPSNIKDENLLGAYATIVYRDGSEVSEYMTFQQIQNSWARGQTKGQSDAHKLAKSEMTKKTVLRRLCKMVYNTSDDSEILDQKSQIEQDIDEQENSQTIDITPPTQMIEAQVAEPEATSDPVDDLPSADDLGSDEGEDFPL
jgi:recombination protein RecT